MTKQEFLKLFGDSHLFSAYDYQKVMKPIDSISDIKELRRLNREGYCIFFTVNEMRGEKRGNKNIKRIRAIWIDDDKPRKSPRKKFPLPPSIVVSTSPGKYQYYWLTSTTNFDEFDLVMQTMIDTYGNDIGVRDYARVLRLPGYQHMKDRDNPHRVKVVGGNKKKYNWKTLRIAFPPAKEVKSSTKVRGKYNRNKAKEAIAQSDDFHGSLRDRAMELANRRLETDDIIAILRNDMERVPESERDKRWYDRYSEEHLYECAESAVKKYEGEEHDDEDIYTIAKIKDHRSKIYLKELPEEIISPKGTVLGELTNALYKTWWVPNIMIAGLAARSMVAYLAGGKYRSVLGDRVNIQQIAIGETGCGKDLLLNQFGPLIDLLYPPKKGEDPDRKQLTNGIVEKVGSAEGLDLKLRMNGSKHDAIWLQDEIGGVLLSAKQETRKREILDMLLEFYTKSDQSLNERALMKRLPEGATKILYAPHIILSGATTPELMTKGLDSSFLSYGSASRMIFFPVDQYSKELVRKKDELSLPTSIITRLRRISIQRDRGLIKYPIARVTSPVVVKFDEDVTELCHKESIKIRRKKLNMEIWNRYVANSKKYAMIEAIAENPRKPVVTMEIMERSLKFVAHSCHYVTELFESSIGESSTDTAKAAVIRTIKKHCVENKVVKMADLNNVREMRKIQPHQRQGILKEMENDGSIVKVEKENIRGKPTITFRLP